MDNRDLIEDGPSASDLTEDGELVREYREGRPYHTKTVRFHLPERGQYLYVMITRLNGEASILGEIGYGPRHYQYAIMTMNKAERLADTDLYNLAHRSGYPLTDLWAFDVLYALDTGDLEWDALADGDKLTPGDVEGLLGGDE